MSATFPDIASRWMREFQALVPERARRALFDDPHPLSCLLRPGVDVFEVVFFERGRITMRSLAARSAISREAIQRLAATKRLSRRLEIGLEVEAPNCFLRRFDVPEPAVVSLENIILSEVERKTPFNSNDVYSGFRIVDKRNEIASIEHIIVKKIYINASLEGSRIPAGDIDFLSLSGNRISTSIFNLNASNGRERLPRRILAVLAAGALGLAAAYVGLTYWSQRGRIMELDEAIGQTRPRLADIRARAEKTTAVRQQDEKFQALRAAPRFTDIWATLTKRLPDDFWLNELRLTQGKEGEKLINLSGFAASPAELVRLLEDSGMFTNTTIGAAITFDPVERKQRFSLQTAFRPHGEHARGAP